MNLTKDFNDYISNIKTVPPIFQFKCKKYSPMFKCKRLLKQITEADKNIKMMINIKKIFQKV